MERRKSDRTDWVRHNRKATVAAILIVILVIFVIIFLGAKFLPLDGVVMPHGVIVAP